MRQHENRSVNIELSVARIKRAILADGDTRKKNLIGRGDWCELRVELELPLWSEDSDVFGDGMPIRTGGRTGANCDFTRECSVSGFWDTGKVGAFWLINCTFWLIKCCNFKT